MLYIIQSTAQRHKAFQKCDSLYIISKSYVIWVFMRVFFFLLLHVNDIVILLLEWSRMIIAAMISFLRDTSSKTGKSQEDRRDHFERILDQSDQVNYV
jgi:hypothetical protein